MIIRGSRGLTRLVVFVVRAKSEGEARQIAHDNAGRENSSGRSDSPRLDAKYSTCERLQSNGASSLIIEDFHAA